MSHRTPSLFDADDPPAPPETRSLVIASRPDRPLSKAERAFNRALTKVQALGRALEDEKQRLDRLLALHAAEIRPRAARARTLRAGIVRALVPFLDDRRLTTGQRRVLRRLLAAQLDAALTQEGPPDADLQALFERLHGLSYAQALQDDLDEAHAGLESMFDELGLDVDVPELSPDMSEEDAAAAMAQFADELRRAGEHHAAEQGPPRARAARTAEQQARRAEQLRKDSLGTVYRRLVKELHPDLESDPAARERKSRVMQSVTAAHARGDLHALLQLELAWLDPGRAAALGDEKLRAYTALLKEQAAELQEEIESLQFHPRYAPLVEEGPFGIPMVVDGAREITRLDDLLGQLQGALARLSSDEALREVRGALREFQDSEKRQKSAARRSR